MDQQKGYINLFSIFSTVVVALVLALVAWVGYLVDEEVQAKKKREKMLKSVGPDKIVIRQRHIGNTEDGCKVFSLYDLTGNAYRISCPQSEIVYTDTGGKSPNPTSVTLDKK